MFEFTVLFQIISDSTNFCFLVKVNISILSILIFITQVLTRLMLCL